MVAVGRVEQSCSRVTTTRARSPFAQGSPANSLLPFAGQSGTGRTTFVNTLCETEVLSHKDVADPSMAHQEEGIKIKPVNVGALQVEERGQDWS